MCRKERGQRERGWGGCYRGGKEERGKNVFSDNISFLLQCVTLAFSSKFTSDRRHLKLIDTSAPRPLPFLGDIFLSVRPSVRSITCVVTDIGVRCLSPRPLFATDRWLPSIVRRGRFVRRPLPTKCHCRRRHWRRRRHPSLPPPLETVVPSSSSRRLAGWLEERRETLPAPTDRSKFTILA